MSHSNLGATLVPHAQNAAHVRATTVGDNGGQSLIFVAHSRFNVLLEAVASRFQCVSGPGKTEWASLFSISPGVRWAYNFKSGLQIVPGIAMPIGAGPSAESFCI